MAVPDYDAFERELTALGQELRAGSGRADILHLRRLERWGRLFCLLGHATAWLAPNPVSVGLLAQGMMARFIIGHHVGHGGYDRVPGVPKRYTKRCFGRGWRRFVDWLDWWGQEDWRYTHNQLHHHHTQAPLDGDIMDAGFVTGQPRWVRYLALAFYTLTWKFTNYAPRMRRERALKDQGAERSEPYVMRLADLIDLADPVVRTLWLRDYLPYIAVRFALPTLLVVPLGSWAIGSMLANLVLAELAHNAHTFVCIRPNHCAPDIPLFTAPFASRREFYLQSVLGTVNYRSGGDVNDFLHGWTNYQVEHHLWPTLPLLQYQRAHPRLVAICAATGVPYREEGVLRRYGKMAKLFMGLQRQPELDTRRLLETAA